ncbi:TOMM precursor leader peptide-binding protein [Variovorax sp. UC74_104]|uniref:TOMM precursor leader peptide-binding protein n=1 Tax=Variovorax sp. UC74_104 TaxID=3374555 RepID=UPI003756E508
MSEGPGKGAPPDFFGDVFRWHDRFLPPVVLDDRLLLASENDLLVLGSPGVMAVERVLREGTSLAAHCRAEGAAAPLAQMLHALEALARQGLVRPVAADGADFHFVPDFSKAYSRTTRTPRTPRTVGSALSADVDAVVLSGAVSEEAASRWALALSQGLPAGTGLTLVFCDDYLDPRLGTIDAQQRARGRAWLPVKPTGEQAMAGPVFRPGAAQPGPCWHCLAHRWLRNRPARAWWQTRHGSAGMGFPVRASAGLVGERLERLLPVALRIAAQADAARVEVLDSPQPQHSIAIRPQCPHCGTPGLVSRRQRERIVLAPGLPTASHDGGWRTVPAAVTVERLMRHVSPLSGVIARIVPLNAEAQGALTVYRSEISRTPPPGDDELPGVLTQVCLGKGMSMEQSRASALCEAAERHAAFFQGDEAWVIAPAAGLDAPCIDPRALALFSERQRERFGTHKPPHAVAPLASSHETPTWWTPAWSLTADERRYLPLSFCFANAPAQSHFHVGWTSNGCAAGNTREEAILQGFLELVERDAAAVWWYGRHRRPAIGLDSLPDEILGRIERACGPRWERWVLDITHDFGIPVVVAVGRHRDTGAWAIGFGCSPDRPLACERALTEMSQLIAAGKTLAVPADEGAEEVGEGTEEGAPPAFLMPAGTAGAAPAVPGGRADIAAEIRRCVGIAASLGLETIVLDHTRPDVPLCTVKVVVPGLCHIWPELGNPRLYRVPVELGWRDTLVREADLNPQALYV